MEATMLSTMMSFVSSVAVTSIKTFLVFSVILLCSELMIGGIDRTRSPESYIMGQTGESRMIGRYFDRCLSDLVTDSMRWIIKYVNYTTHLVQRHQLLSGVSLVLV